MKLGISSFTYGWAVGVPEYPPKTPLSFIDLINLTHKYKLSLLQIGDNLPIDQLSPQELRNAKNALAKYQIDLEIGCRGLTEDRLRTYLNLCVFFSAKLLRVVIDVGNYTPSDSEIIILLRKVLPEFEKNQVTLAIENHDRFHAKQLAEIIQQINSKFLGICLDTANSFGCLEGVETITEALLPYTVNLHAKDVEIHRLPSQLGFIITGTSACDGMLNLPSLIKQIYTQRPETNCILEQWTAYTDTLEKTIAKEAAEAEKGIQTLKNILKEIESTNITFSGNL